MRKHECKRSSVCTRRSPLDQLVERVEFEYIRHDTLCLMANFDVATGKVVAPSIGPTRSEADFVANIEQTVEADR